MTASQLVKLLLALPPDATVTVGRDINSQCADCGSDGYVNAVTIDYYDQKAEVTLICGTDPLDDTRKATP